MIVLNDLNLPSLAIGQQAFADAPDRIMFAAREQHK